MSRRVAAWLAGIALVAIAGWMLIPNVVPEPATVLLTGDALPHSTRDAADQTTADTIAAAFAPSGSTKKVFEIQLLADGAVSADPESVRIGLGYISAEDDLSHQDWLKGGRDGAGPASREELAVVERWINTVATRRADGVVIVSGDSLPWADRYDLQARGNGGLHFYSASFTAAAYPASIRPTVAAGIRIVRGGEHTQGLSLLLRRVSESTDTSTWQALMSREAPHLLASFDEAAIDVSAGDVLSPIPPGAIDVILMLQNIEAQRTSITLVAGKITEISPNPLDARVARALSVDLELEFRVQGTQVPLRQLEVVWAADRGDQTQQTDVRGRVRFEGVDRQQSVRLRLQFPTSDSALPQWPLTKAIGVDLDDEGISSEQPQIFRKTIELRPLQWLVVRMGAIALSTERRAGNPYPIYVLQYERDGIWADASADYFLGVPEGLAVSVEQAANARAAIVRSPWSVLYSSAADTRVASHDGRHQVTLREELGHPLDIALLDAGAPIVGLPVVVRGPTRSLPATTVTADGRGQIRLEGVTVPRLSLEAPGFAVVEVDARQVQSVVELQREAQ